MLMKFDEKECPYCAEVIKLKAIKCKYCKSDLDLNAALKKTSPTRRPSIAEKVEKARRTSAEATRIEKASEEAVCCVKSGMEPSGQLNSKQQKQLQNIERDPWGNPIVKKKVTKCSRCGKAFYRPGSRLCLGCARTEAREHERSKEVDAWRKERELKERKFIDENPNKDIVCPICQTQGFVILSPFYGGRKKVFSTSKATAGIITGGLSLFVTGLGKKEKYITHFDARCSKCGNAWQVMT
jgi:ribosomal protein L37E